MRSCSPTASSRASRNASTRWSRSSPTTHKPGPEPIEHALELLGRPREGAVYVGDAASDLQAARAAGVAAVGVTWGAFDYDGLAAERPDAIATSPAELAGILSTDG